MDALGIDIGGTSVKAAMLRDGDVLWTGKSGPYAQASAGKIVAAMREAIAHCGEKTDRVGLCCPGLLDREKRAITLCVNVPGLMGASLDELVAEGLGRSVPAAEILSDANAAAYDLYATRNLCGRLLSLTLGTGVGASVIDEGRFLQVSGETPGHFGQMDVSLDETPPIGADGGAGSLEAYLGSAALAARYGENAVERLNVGDPAIRALVRAIRIAHAIYRPRHVGLAGGVGIRLGRLLPLIKTEIDRNLTAVARADWDLFAGESDFHAACGVGRYALTHQGVAS
jgi:predicted NBD/HSP70 family sugar kinase